MGFAAAWLDLRAPADERARDDALVEKAVAFAGPRAHLLDLGCGTGAMVRAFAAKGAQNPHWYLLDNDSALLDLAQKSHPGADVILQNLKDLDAIPLGQMRMVTASALFDLVSEHWAMELVARLARYGIALYATLSYDGVMRWAPSDPLDSEITRRFNTHQLGDKGFGPAMGPQAGPRLVALLRQAGYTVEQARSAWRLGPDDAALQQVLISGIARAAQEDGLAKSETEGWTKRRIAMLKAAHAEIGHVDLLALPGGG